MANILKRKNNKNINNKKNKKPVKILKTIGTVILSIFLVLVITGSIVATALTVYVMQFMDETNIVKIGKDNIHKSSVFYALNDKGEQEITYSLASLNNEKMEWVDFEDVPQHVKDAFIYAEDPKFYEHEGIDFMRTFLAVVNEIFHLRERFGASTITQQIIKNINEDFNDRSISKKIQEIFGSLGVEKKNTKDQILETYMNIASFHYNMKGVQTASKFYFNKDVSQLTIAQAASIAAITKSPKNNNMINYPENNKARRSYILKNMYDYGAISSEEYDAAIKEKIVPIGYNKVDPDSDTNTKNSSQMSYFIEAARGQAIDILMDIKNISRKEAIKALKNDGYKIYTTENQSIQDQLEKKMANDDTFRDKGKFEYKPQAACMIMDYKGNVLGVIGGRGEKTESLGLHRATTYTGLPFNISPGSTIKPFSSYGPAIELDLTYWSERHRDDHLTVNPFTGEDLGEGNYFEIVKGKKNWPVNYNSRVTKNYYSTWEHLAKSNNTVAAELTAKLTVDKSYEFMTKKFPFTTLDPATNKSIAPLAIGSGATINLEELTNAYQVFGNQGRYYKATYIEKITNTRGEIIYKHNYASKQALSSDSAWVMNRMLKTVFAPELGVGTARRYGRKGIYNSIEVIGKTGTSDDDRYLLTVGCTPDYIMSLRMGYDNYSDTKDKNGKVLISSKEKYAIMAQHPSSGRERNYRSSRIWNNIFKDIANTSKIKKFTPDASVIEAQYCTKTGKIATSSCPHSKRVGYFKKSNAPYCDECGQSNEE